jgi:nitrate reductase NapD
MSDSVAREFATIDGVEVHGVLPDGQIIAVIEADTVQAEVDIVAALHAINNVVTVRMAYHNFEDIEALQAPPP